MPAVSGDHRRNPFVVHRHEAKAVVAEFNKQMLMNCSPSVYRETLELGENSGIFASELVMIRSMNSSGNVHRSAYTSPTAALSGTTRLAVVFNSTDGAWDIYKDGISVRNTVTGTQDDNGYVLTNNTFTLGARSVDNNVFQGHLFEVIAYTNSLSAADVQSVDAYLNKLYVQTARAITVFSSGKGAVSLLEPWPRKSGRRRRLKSRPGRDTTSATSKSTALPSVNRWV